MSNCTDVLRRLEELEISPPDIYREAPDTRRFSHFARSLTLVCVISLTSGILHTQNNRSPRSASSSGTHSASRRVRTIWRRRIISRIWDPQRSRESCGKLTLTLRPSCSYRQQKLRFFREPDADAAPHKAREALQTCCVETGAFFSANEDVAPTRRGHTQKVLVDRGGGATLLFVLLSHVVDGTRQAFP